MIAKRDDDNRPGDGRGSDIASNSEARLLEIELLAELRAALAEREVSSELREDLACIAVKGSASHFCIWVFVGFNGRYFSWGNAEYQHPIRDIPGAALRITSQIHGATMPNAGEAANG